LNSFSIFLLQEIIINEAIVPLADMTVNVIDALMNSGIIEWLYSFFYDFFIRGRWLFSGFLNEE